MTCMMACIMTCMMTCIMTCIINSLYKTCIMTCRMTCIITILHVALSNKNNNKNCQPPFTLHYADTDAHMSAKSPSNICHKHKEGIYVKFRNPTTTFETPRPCPPKYTIVQGEGGVPKSFWVGEILIFLLLRAARKIS